MRGVEVCDLMRSDVDASTGEVRVNIGNAVDGVGFGASVGMWGVDGFLSRPNAAADSNAAQGLYMTQGNQRRVFASRDTRWAGPFGALGEGDRAIVSDCDAGLWLDQSANIIKLQAGAGVEVKIDGDAGTVTVSKGTGVTVTLSATAISLVYNPTSLAIPPASIVLSAAGVAIVGTTTVNGIPVP